MSVQRITISIKMLWQLIEHEQNQDSFSLEGAVASMLYDLSRGRELSQREYAKAWGWTHKKTRYHWDNIVAQSELFWLNSQGHTKGTLWAQKEANTDQNRNVGAHEGHTKGTQLINNTINSSIKTLDNNQSSAPRKETARARKLPDGVTYDLVFDSWNTIAQELGFPTVKSRTDKRKKAILKLAARLWPKMDQAYENMRNGSRWFREELRPGFDWVWNETNFTKIYEGNYLHERTPSNVGSDIRRNGTLYHPEAGAGRAVPGGVHSRQKTPARNPKRPGEYSPAEYLRESGWTEEDLRLFGDDPEVGGRLPAHSEGDDA